MDLKKSLHFTDQSENCIFRSLHEKDVSEDYVTALNSQRSYLFNNPVDLDIEWQREYVRRIRLSKSDAICGLFAKTNLIGTAGMQSLSREGEETTLGMLVLDKVSRGKGYGKTLVWSACYLLKSLLGTRRFTAGAERYNKPSIRTFLACGFAAADSSPKKYKLELDPSDLVKPDFINNVLIV